MKSIGASMQRFAAIGALAGGSAIKMAMDFDKNITKINALVGTSGEELDDMAQASKEMAKVTKYLVLRQVNALFFIASAGLKGTEALEVLEASSKASALVWVK